MFEELKDYIASHTKEEIQEDWKETPEFESPGKAFYEITDSIPTKSERKVVKEYLNHYRYYQY